MPSPGQHARVFLFLSAEVLSPIVPLNFQSQMTWSSNTYGLAQGQRPLFGVLWEYSVTFQMEGNMQNYSFK